MNQEPAGLALVHGDGSRHEVSPSASVFSSMQAFENSQRMAKALACSDLVPETYRNNIANTLIALEIANRIGCSPLMVMQNLYIVHGRPSWSSTFIIAAINACGRFSPLRFELAGEGDDKGCYAWATDKSGERLEGTRVTMGMAKAEQWMARKGSKWQTMPELMLRYRAATFFGRMYAPEILMGMRPADEQEDIQTVRQARPAVAVETVIDTLPIEDGEGRLVEVTTGEVLAERQPTGIEGQMAAALAGATLGEWDEEP